jgi:putative thioredoxin
MDVTAASFESEVLAASATYPVLVDFWAPWCGPCKALGPVLEKLEKEYAGRWRLAKINSDDNGDIASAYGVRSIPNVIAFRNGRPVAQFVGAQPESQVRAFIERLMPSPHEKTLALAQECVDSGRIDEAEKLLDTIPSNIDWDAKVEALRAAIAFRRGGGNEEQLKEKISRDPADHESRLALAGLYAGGNRYRDAMEQLMEIARRDKAWRDGEARKQMLTLFTLAADQPELVSEYRRKLATALY